MTEKLYCLNDYGPDVISKVKEYFTKSIVSLKKVKLQEYVDTLIEKIRYQQTAPSYIILFTLNWEVTFNEILIAAGLAMINKEEEEALKERDNFVKIGGSCPFCLAVSGQPHRESCIRKDLEIIPPSGGSKDLPKEATPSFIETTKDGFTYINERCPYCLSLAGSSHKENCPRAIFVIDNFEEEITENYNPLKKQNSSHSAPKDKEGKPDWYVFPFEEAEEVLKVFEYGASQEKYKRPFSYREGNGVDLKDLYSATMRHLKEIHKGEMYDDESNCLHWAHVAANALMSISTLRKVKS